MENLFSNHATAEAVDLQQGRDEINFAEFPLWYHGTRSPSVKTLVFESQVRDSGVGRIIPRKLTITAADAWGLPTVRDADVLFALLLIAYNSNGFREKILWFTTRQLLKVLGWDDCGRNYKRIDLAIKRWDGVHIVFEGWYDIKTGTWSKRPKLCGILNGGQLREPGQEGDYLSFIRWQDDFLETLQAGSIRRLDLEKWQAISSPTAKQAYRYLEKEFHIRPVVEVDLKQFACENIGLSRKEEPNKLRKALNGIFEELEQVGCIEKEPPENRYRRVDRSTWRVTIRQARSSPAARDIRQRELFIEDGLTGELLACGVTQRVAESLVQEYPAEMILEKIELLRWYQTESPKEAPNRPGGWLAAAIRENYAPPKDFQTKAEREDQAAKKAAALAARDTAERERQAEEKRHREETAARELYEWQCIEDYLAGLSEREREEVITKAIEEQPPLVRKKARSGKVSGGQPAGRNIYYELALRNYLLPLLQQDAASVP